MDEKKLKGINFPGLNGTYIVPPVDSELSTTSTNPVQNKVIAKLFADAQTSLEQIVRTIPGETEINALIDEKLGVIENGYY